MKICFYSSFRRIIKRIYPWIFSYLAFRTWTISTSKRGARTVASGSNALLVNSHEAWNLLNPDGSVYFYSRHLSFTTNSSSSFSNPHSTSLNPSFPRSTSSILPRWGLELLVYCWACFGQLGLIVSPYYFCHRSCGIYSRISLDCCSMLSIHCSSQLLRLPNNYNPHWCPPFNGYNNPIIFSICTKAIPNIIILCIYCNTQSLWLLIIN